MLRSMNKLSLRQTINHVVYELKDQGQDDGPNEEDFSWKDIVQRCLEVRQDRLLANIPDLTITDSQPSICLNENLFADLETGRDASHGEFSDQNLVLDCPSVIKSPSNSRSNRNSAIHRPTTLIEEVPDSPCSSASSSSYSLPHASPFNSPSRSSISQSPATSPVRTSRRSSTKTLSNSANSSVNESVRSSRSSRLSIPETKNKSPRRSLIESTPTRSYKLSSSRSSRNSAICSSTESSKRSSSSSATKSPSDKRSSSSKSSPLNSSSHSSSVRSPRRSIIEEAILSFEESNKSARNSATSSTAKSSNSSIVKSSEKALSFSSLVPSNSSHSSSPRRSDSKIKEREPARRSSLSPSCSSVYSSNHSSPAHSPVRPSNSSFHSPLGSSCSSARSPVRSLHSSPPRSYSVHSPLKSTKKSDNKKTSKQLTQKLNEENRSRPWRQCRGKRLQTWRGEHPIYKPMENGCFSIEGFTKPRPPDTLKRKKSSSQGGKRKIKKVASKEMKNDVDNNIDAKIIDLSESLIQNSEIARRKMNTILKTTKNLCWKKSKFCDQIEHAIITNDKENGFVIGIHRFLGKCETTNQKTGDYTITFTMMRGLVSIKVGEEPHMIINPLESITIPVVTNYKIKNLVDDESVLQFYIFGLST